MEAKSVHHMYKHCSKEFGEKCTLYRHIRNVHEMEPRERKMFECSLCNASFGKNYDLMRHKRNLHGVDQYAEKRAATISSIGTALPFNFNGYGNEEHFSCQHCSRPFISKEKRDAHERTHWKSNSFLQLR